MQSTDPAVKSKGASAGASGYRHNIQVKDLRTQPLPTEEVCSRSEMPLMRLLQGCSRLSVLHSSIGCSHLGEGEL